jgi:RNA recognition motif-containing protein
MENDEEALKAIAGLHESEVMGRKLVVNQARPQEKKPGGGFGNRGRDSRGGEGRNWR